MLDPYPATPVLCEPAQSKCTWTCHKRHFVQKFTRKMPDASDTTSIEHRSLTPTVRTPQCGHTVWGKKRYQVRFCKLPLPRSRQKRFSVEAAAQDPCIRLSVQDAYRRSPQKLFVRDLKERSLFKVSRNALRGRPMLSSPGLCTGSPGKISAKCLLARSLNKVSMRGLLARSLHKLPLRRLLARFLYDCMRFLLLKYSIAGAV